MSKDIEELTAKEAIEQGYTHWGYDNGTGDFQRLQELSEFTHSHFKDAVNYGYGTPVLAQRFWYMGRLQPAGNSIR